MFTLPKLPYAYDALSPYIDALTMEIHHTKHHQGYVNKLNAALKNVTSHHEKIEDVLTNIQDYNQQVRNNAGGHYNHTLFWESMAPTNQAKQPRGALKQAIARDFGTLEQCIEKFSVQAISLFGAGWTWICLDTQGKLHILNTPNQDNPLMHHEKHALVPLLCLDVWEHAYYLKYQNRRADYVKAFWNIVNWEVVSQRFEAASRRV